MDITQGEEQQNAETWILALDTASSSVSAAVTNLTGEVTAQTISREPHQHTEMLLPLVDGLLESRGLALKEAAAIAFSAGPGAFAGVRTACAAAQGLAWAVDKPVIAVPTLEAAAVRLLENHPEALCVMPVLDARMHECYVQVFERTREGALPCPVTEAFNLAPNALPAFARTHGVLVAGGTGLKAYPEAEAGLREFLAEGDDELEVTAEVVAQVGRLMMLAGQTTPPALAAPIYVRNRVALTIEERRRGEKLQ